VILMTAYHSVDSAVRAIQLPVVAYLVKPFEFAELLLEVRKALAQAGAARAVRGVQQRWQAWGQELEQLAEVARPRSQETAEVTVGALVSFTLRNLAGCLSDLQRLQEALTAGQALRPRSGQALRPRSGQAKHSSENGSDRRDGVPSVHPTLPEDSFELQEMGLNGKQQVRVLPVELRAALQQLSRREREVLRLLLANKRTRTIAKTLFISPQTVRNHLRAIFSKLGVHSQIELLERVGPYRLHEA
jgi:DNA-binding NarL/FixJ family response regulator